MNFMSTTKLHNLILLNLIILLVIGDFEEIDHVRVEKGDNAEEKKSDFLSMFFIRKNLFQIVNLI